MTDLAVDTSEATRSIAAGGSSPTGVAVMVAELERFATELELVDAPITVRREKADLVAAIRRLAQSGRASLVPSDPDDRLSHYGTDPAIDLLNGLTDLNAAALAVDAVCSRYVH